MHQSPLKQLGAPRRPKHAALDLDGDGEADRRLARGAQPRARRFQREEPAPGPRTRHREKG